MKLSIIVPVYNMAGGNKLRFCIDSLLAHHQRRLAEALSLVKENPGMNACQIAGLMKWKIRAASWETFPLVQKWFAVGECLAHLDYFLQRGQLSVKTGPDGIRRYYA